VRLVPKPWGNSWFDYVKAVVTGLILLMGLVVAMHRGSWILATVWAVLVAGALIAWGRDLMKAMQRKS
jgi:4-hydroxybenzoate polyprenyltransferase